MTNSTLPPYDAICDDLLGRGGADGALFSVFLDHAQRVLLTTEVGEGTRHVDELFLKHLVGLVSDMDVAEVVFAVVRTTGRPARLDRVLWRELSTRLHNEPCVLRDLLVVGPRTYWSAASGAATTRED